MDTNVAAYPVQDGTGQDMQFVCGRVTLGTRAATLRANPAHCVLSCARARPNGD